MLNQIDSPTLKLDTWLYKVCMVIARLILAYLFFTQLFWKLPPKFGCGANYAFPIPAEQNYFDSNGSSGLCYWMGLEFDLRFTAAPSIDRRYAFSWLGRLRR